DASIHIDLPGSSVRSRLFQRFTCHANGIRGEVNNLSRECHQICSVPSFHEEAIRGHDVLATSGWCRQPVFVEINDAIITMKAHHQFSLRMLEDRVIYATHQLLSASINDTITSVIHHREKSAVKSINAII